MTEKQYGGNTGRGSGNKLVKPIIKKIDSPTKVKTFKTEKSPKIKKLELTNNEKILKAGKIASEVRDYAKTIVKKGDSLLNIAEKIEAKIIELGGKPAFPINLSINEVAAHYTPSYDDKSIAHGLIKIDFGAHIDGWISDTAFSLDLENIEENKKLIEASEKALEEAIKISNSKTPLNKIGETIQKNIESFGYLPIVNLCGHSMEEYQLHSGITIPNFDNQKTILLGEGLRAIEPFATNGVGKIKDSKPSEIYMLVDEKTPRSPIAREILNFVSEEYQTLPFCSRWLVKKIGLKSIIGLKQLEENGNLHRFAQLVEDSGGKVSQAEHTLLIEKEKTIVITKEH
jgi:methionyl aminopeptidase